MFDVIMTFWIFCSFILLIILYLAIKNEPELFEEMVNVPEPMRSLGGLIIILGGPVSIIIILSSSGD
jgi:hypothetical protein